MNYHQRGDYGPAVIKFKAINTTDPGRPPVIYFTVEELLNQLVACGTIDPWPRKQNLVDLLMFRDHNTSTGAIRMFTGFQDRQGQDIYGGDLVSLSFRREGDTTQYLVHWSEGEWVVGNWQPGSLCDMTDDITLIGPAP